MIISMDKLQELDPDSVRLEVLSALEYGDGTYYPGVALRVKLHPLYVAWLLWKFGGSAKGEVYISRGKRVVEWLACVPGNPVSQKLASGVSIRRPRGSGRVLDYIRDINSGRGKNVIT